MLRKWNNKFNLGTDWKQSNNEIFIFFPIDVVIYLQAKLRQLVDEWT